MTPPVHVPVAVTSPRFVHAGLYRSSSHKRADEVVHVRLAVVDASTTPHVRITLAVTTTPTAQQHSTRSAAIPTVTPVTPNTPTAPTTASTQSAAGPSSKGQ